MSGPAYGGRRAAMVNGSERDRDGVQLRVVVAVDFSDGSAIATAEAKRIADQLGAELVAIHVAPGPRAEPWAADAEAASWLVRASLPADALVLRYGVPWVELVRFAKETRPVVMVAGSHGGSGFQPLSPGSTVGRLCVMSAVPLMVVSPATLRWSALEREHEVTSRIWNGSEQSNDTFGGGT